MMNAVHPRSYNDQVQEPLDLNWQPPVRMVKQSSNLECDKEDHQHYRVDAKDHHSERKKADGKDHFAEMESRSSAHVHVEVGVMHVMKPPEQRHHVVAPVPPPVGVIHQ